MSLRFPFIACGIFSLYCIYSILQEKLLKGVYGEEKEQFKFFLPLLFVVTVFNSGYAYLIQNVNKRTVADNKIPTLYITLISLCYLSAMTSSYMALQWVSYPAQVIAKSAKPIPVLVMGVLVGNKSFPLRKYLIIFLIVTGIYLFNDKTTAKLSEGFGFGEILLTMSLLMDGLTSSLQERVMSKFKPKSDQLMLEMNKRCMILIGIAILVTGELFEFLAFMQRHPSSIILITSVSFFGALGQFFIFLCLTEYGTLTCSIVTTTRKFFTVLGSVIVFGHVFRAKQWFGVFLVFSGLFLDIYYSTKAKKSTEKRLN